jgi:ABC-2 type transport system permease protein
MTRPARYLGLLGVQLRASLLHGLQYRADFVVEGLMALYWIGWNLVPLFVLFDRRATVAGWDFPSALLVIAWFTALKGLLEGAINPSLIEVTERIRSGSFDYVLLKPADAQFLVSTARFEPWKLLDVVGGVGLAVWAFVLRGAPPAPLDLALCLVLLAAGAVVLYALWICVVSASFWVVKLDNLVYLFGALFDAARWPAQIFRGVWRFVFTFVLPLALMTTYPAMAALGRLDGAVALAAIGGAAAFAAVARLCWRTALGAYTSASS